MMGLTKYVNKNIVKYLGLSYVNVGLNVLINLLLIKKLTTIDFGRVSIGKTIFQSFDFTHVGIRNGFDRVFPAEKDKVKIINLFSVGFISTLIVSILFLFFWSFYKINDFKFYIYFSISGLLSALISLYRIYFRTFEDKSKFVELSFYFILFPSILQILGFFVFGLYGFISSTLLSYVIVGVIIFKKYNVRLNFSSYSFRSYLSELLDKGFLLYLTSLISFFSTSADRFFIEHYWGLDAVGRFSVIMFFFSIFSVFAVNYTEMFMNKIISYRSLKYVMKHMATLFIVSFILIIIVYFTLPFLVSIFMPKYLKEIHLINIILIGVIPFSLRSLLYYYLHAIDKRKILFYTDLFTSLIYLAALFFILNKPDRSMDLVMYAKVLFYFSGVLIVFIYSLLISKKTEIKQYD